MIRFEVSVSSWKESISRRTSRSRQRDAMIMKISPWFESCCLPTWIRSPVYVRSKPLVETISASFGWAKASDLHIWLSRDWSMNAWTGRFEDLFIDINKHLIEKEMIHTDVHRWHESSKPTRRRTASSGEMRFRITKRLYLKITKFYASLGLETRNATPLMILNHWSQPYTMTAYCIRLSSLVEKETIRTELQKRYDTIKAYHAKLVEYERHFAIFQEAKQLFQDRPWRHLHAYEGGLPYMRTGIFKPGYNVQLGVSDEYVLMKQDLSQPHRYLDLHSLSGKLQESVWFLSEDTGGRHGV